MTNYDQALDMYTANKSEVVFFSEGIDLIKLHARLYA